METVEFRLAGQIVEPPKGWAEDNIQVELNFDRDKETVTQQVNVTNLEWVRDNNDTIQQWIADGINGQGPGIFEGIPFSITVSAPGETPAVLHDGYLDLTDEAELSINIKSTVKIREKDTPDFLNETADGFDFGYLYKSLAAGDPGKISSSDFVPVPYILNSVPNYREAALGLISIYVLGNEIKAAIQGMVELAAEMANPFEATAIVRAVLRVAYLIILIAAIIQMIKDTVLLVIQPVKYHQGMYLLKQLQKGAEHMGYNFKSPILESAPWNTLFIIPEKNTVPVNAQDDRIFGFTQPAPTQQDGYYKGTFGDLLRAAKALIKGKVLFKPGNELWLVREDENISTPEYQIPDVRQDYFTYNTDEFNANYLITFATDVVDKNTIQQYTGTSYQVITKPNVINNQNMVLMKGFKRVDIPFALAKRKETLTTPEKIIKGLLDVLDAIINALISAVNAVINVYNEVVKVLNKIIDALDFIGIEVGWEIPSIPTIPPVNLGALIENRIGMLMIEIDQIAVPKLLLLDESGTPKLTKLNPNNSTTLTAKNAYNTWHFIQSFIPDANAGRPAGNQWKKIVFNKLPFNLSGLNQIKTNNAAYAPAGTAAEIDGLVWSPRKQYANMRARLAEIYTLNLQQTFIEPDGK